MVIDEGYFFENASLLVSSPVEYGDLLTAINLYKANQVPNMFCVLLVQDLRHELTHLIS